MFDPQTPYNDLPLITTLDVDTAGLSKLAEDTRVAIEILNYSVKTLPNPNILLDTLALQEARASSNIENIVTTNDDLYRGIVFDDFTAEAKEVSRYKDALFTGYTRMMDKGLISLSDIEAINEPVNQKKPGIRTNLMNFNDLTQIANRKPTGKVEVIYTPPHGVDLLYKLLIDMLDFVYDDDTYDLHPLIKIALAHYQFESIHPFRDGNGRTGRILNVLFLCHKGYLNAPILYASSYIIRNKNQYYDLLQTCKETERYEPIIEFMLRSFKETAEHTLRIVESICSLLAQYSDEKYLITMKGQLEPLKNTVNVIFKKVYVRIADLVDLGIHRQTAADYLDQFVDRELLSKDRVGRENIYKNIKLLKLFDYDSEVTK
ncbi:MAG: Fic family protein [Clostridiaceae bacterium]|nr:Fic family protein [Clostridia bacterium]NMA36614.1 Fic family protein [Clostridiaceae bacterium]HKM16933.1 Fic/DOC family N-terminal domain-containing protein [Limnochordia bacterium]